MVLGIYGAGGLGREVLELANVINRVENIWHEIAFIDDAEIDLNEGDINIYNLEKFVEINEHKNIEICIAVGEPALREKLFAKLKSYHIDLATLIHPTVEIPISTVLMEGVIVNKFTSISCDIIIEENVYIHPLACVGHDSIIGRNSIISSFSDVAGDCKVGHCAYLAINAIMKQGTSIGNNTIIGLASVVHNDIKEGVIAMGNPARPMKNNEDRRVFGK